MRNTIKYLKWLRGSYLYLFTMLIAILVSTYTRTWIPLFTQHTLSYILGDSDSKLPQFIFDFVTQDPELKRQLFLTGLSLVILMIFRGVIIFFEGRQGAILSEKIADNMRKRMYGHIQDLPYSFHSNAETGDLIQRSTSDIDTIRKFIGGQLAELIRSVLLFLFIFGIMLSLNVKMALISIIVIPIIFVFAIVYFNRIQKQFKITEEAESKMTTTLQENLSGIRVVKAFANEKYELEKFNTVSRIYADQNYKIVNSMAVYWSTSDLICFLQIIITVVAGVYYTSIGEIDLGILVAFVIYVQNVLWPIRNLGRIIAEMGKTSVSLRRIDEIISMEDEYQEENTLQPVISGDIELNDVYFQFPDSTKDTLKGISIHIKQGETVAIIGKTGSGKSTLVNLLIRLLDYHKGSIKIDDTELNRMDKKWLRKHVGIVFQEPFLYSKTLIENIAIVKEDINEPEVYQVAQVASLHDDIGKFEKGYSTLIGERGVTLSGGQKQRVAIARTLIEEKPILIFDDSLSAVDTETDLNIRSALSKYSSKVTKIIITHRVTTAMDADQIIILEDGKIMERGNHQTLMESNGVYRKLWDIQNYRMDEEEGEWNE